MAEEALEGLKGVKLFNSFYRGLDEYELVWYDPVLTDVETIENALKEVGAYLGTVDAKAQILPPLP